MEISAGGFCNHCKSFISDIVFDIPLIIIRQVVISCGFVYRFSAIAPGFVQLFPLSHK